MNERLVVFIVPESPVWGVDRGALRRSLELIERHFPRHKPGDGGGGGSNNIDMAIVGPIFSGSQASLQQTLMGWIDEERKGLGTIHLSIMGTASQLDLDAFYDRLASDKPKVNVSIHSFRHETKLLAAAMSEHLRGKLGAERIALLEESNTGFGQMFAASQKPTGNAAAAPLEADHYRFPMRVSSLREKYEKLGVLKPQGLTSEASPEQLSVSSAERRERSTFPEPLRPRARRHSTRWLWSRC